MTLIRRRTTRSKPAKSWSAKHGFKKLPIRDPYAAPLGAVIVYGKGSNGAGHVELRTKNGFVSDYTSKNRCYYPVIAVYGKFSS